MSTIQEVKLLNQIMANCVGTEHFNAYRNLLPSNEEWPQNAELARDIRTACIEMQKFGALFTIDNISEFLAISKVFQDVETAKKTIADFVKQYAVEGNDVKGLIGAYLQIKRQKALKAVLGNSLQALENGAFVTAEWIRELLGNISAVVPPDSGFSFIESNKVLFERMEHELEERYKAIRSGKSIMAEAPYSKLRQYVTGVDIGNVAFFEAVTGTGKTSSAIHWAFHNALIGHDVLFVHNETAPFSIYKRIISAQILLPLQVLDVGWYYDGTKRAEVDINDINSPIGAAYQKAKDRIYNMKGEIIYFYCPGATFEDIQQRVALQSEISKSNGKLLVVVIDYFNNIALSNTKIYNNQATALGNVMDRLKDMAGSYSVPLILFGQSAPKEGDSANGDEPKGISTSRGSLQTVIRSQIYCRMESTVADQDMPYHGLKDILGNQVYWHKRGDRHALTTFNITKQNEGRLGKAEIMLGRSLFFHEDWITKDYFTGRR